MKNSAEFAQNIREVELMEGDMMISFDVVSLFTKVPIDGALQVISTLLAQDDSLEERTSITVSDICQLTELCL